MLTITLVLLLTLSVLGGILRLAFDGYLSQQQKKDLSSCADAVSELMQEYFSSFDLDGGKDLEMGLRLATEMSETDVVICNEQGEVAFCSCPDFPCEHTSLTLGGTEMETARKKGQSYFVDTLPGIYNEKRHVRIEKEPFGFVIVSSPVKTVTADTQGLFTVFFQAAVLVWILAFIATFLLYRHEVRPLREMAQTVRRFGYGDLSVRAKHYRSNTREMEELTTAFNNMASALERADRQRQEFVANVSHELRTPMTSIGGYMDGMLDGTIPQSEHEEYMRVVSQEVKRLSRLVKSMLELSRMQAEGVDQEKLSCFDLGDCAAQVLLSFEQKIRQKRLEVELDIPEEPLYTVAHRDSVTQVIYNLTENAVKFCNDCGYLTLRLRPEGGKLHLTVQNTGAVIPAAELPLIFDRFHKLDKSRRQDPDGVGLGLYIVKTIVGAHGENIWVESHDGVTAFTFTMPAVKNPPRREEITQ